MDIVAIMSEVWGEQVSRLEARSKGEKRNVREVHFQLGDCRD